MTVEQIQQLFDYLETTGDRLEHLHHLAVQTGLRRGELAGLKWSDIDLDAETITVARQRVHSEAGAVVAETKTDAGRRELPIPATLLPVLKRARRRAAAEQLAVGNKWRGEDYVVADELGRAYYPTTYPMRPGRSGSVAHRHHHKTNRISHRRVSSSAFRPRRW